MKFLILSILLAVSNFQATGQKSLDMLLQANNSESIPYISVEELRMLQLHDSVVILDSREKEEYAVSHILSAKNVGYNLFSVEEASAEIADKNTSVVVYCSIGIRSAKIGEKLEKQGFTNVKNLYGGIFEWKNNGYPIIDSNGNNTEEVHVFSEFWGQWLHKGIKVY